jgi:hypothetical protein
VRVPEAVGVGSRVGGHEVAHAEAGVEVLAGPGCKKNLGVIYVDKNQESILRSRVTTPAL